MSRAQYRPDIDGLRAIAVLVVVIFHYLPAKLPGGYIGVDIFFVISGYLITGILLREIDSASYSILRFYSRRIRRIFPALLLVLGASYLYALFFVLPNEFVELAKQSAAGAGFVANLLLWSQSGYFDTAINFKPLMHLWSLGVEEQYYLVWPLLLLLTIGRGKRFRIGLVLTVAAASLVWSLSQSHIDPTGAFYSPLTRFWQLLAGALLAALPQARIEAVQARVGNVLSIAGVVLIGLGARFMDGHNSLSAFWGLVPVAAAFMIILAGQAAWFNRVVLSSRVPVSIGLISYPLYLWHWPIISFLYIRFGYVPFKAVVGGLLASFVLAAATYLLVEKPLKRVGERRQVAILLAGMVLFFAISLATVFGGFLVRPLTPLQQALLTEYNTREVYRFKTCFLDSQAQTGSDLAPECSPERAPDKRLVLLWGDSLTAQLYPGLKALSEQHAEAGLLIAQRSSSSCPAGTPDDVSGNGNCDAINAATRDYIVKNRPEIVVLNGRWLDGARAPEVRLADITRFLKENGVEKVILFGPAPDWWPDLRKMLLRMHFENDELPQRMMTPPPAWTAVTSLDDRMEKIAADNGLSYVSVRKHFCEGDQCLIRVSDDAREGLITSDHDHMTAAASIWLLKQPDVLALFGR